ncbi:LIM domain transcription factor LMO4 [Acromyrmex echinatior]|uniref:LIM domain transcription factor LMO4 n=1 Tax=Acromyrmex echinatior TaxID=103372 RepID=F4WJC2_ACREC|nr:LIM domain transcription factor LMO4 [Acromyrmex echinatior]
MNPHHPGHSAAYPHHPSLSSSPHHPGPGGPHHAYGTGGGGGGGGGGGTTTTPDLPSPHSPQHSGGAGDPATPYGALQPGQGMGSNGHHHSGGGMMPDHPHHPGHPHPHMPGHPAYPPVNHNNNCTLKQEGVPSGSTGLRQCAACGVQIVERWLLLAMDRYWHIGCLKCTYCNVVLGEIGQSCYTKSGMILCKADYRRFTIKLLSELKPTGCLETPSGVSCARQQRLLQPPRRKENDGYIRAGRVDRQMDREDSERGATRKDSGEVGETREKGWRFVSFGFKECFNQFD